MRVVIKDNLDRLRSYAVLGGRNWWSRAGTLESGKWNSTSARRPCQTTPSIADSAPLLNTGAAERCRKVAPRDGYGSVRAEVSHGSEAWLQ